MATIDLTNAGFKLDRLSLCYTEADHETVKTTCGALLDSKYKNFYPHFFVTKTYQYAVNCRFKVPFDNNEPNQQTIFFQAGPLKPGLPSYRWESNPDKITQAGWIDLWVFLETNIDVDPIAFFAMSKVTRLDVALDLPSLCQEQIIVRSSGLQKHGVYSDRYGGPQTTYLGMPSSRRRIVAYDKPIDTSGHTSLRIETRLKPECRGHEVAELKNPFAKVKLIPADFSKSTGSSIPPRLLADSVRLGGIKRAMTMLSVSEAKALQNAYQSAVSLLPSTDSIWAKWPETLKDYGLGKHLGAVSYSPVTQPASAP